jgi:KH domain
MCEIDQKLHAIVAGRKRNTLQTIMEETGTNIYLPSPLQGLVGPDPAAAGGANLGNTRNIFWITGEFFGVQRARDMLYNVSLQKVGLPITSDLRTLTRMTGKEHHVKGHRYPTPKARLDGH